MRLRPVTLSAIALIAVAGIAQTPAAPPSEDTLPTWAYPYHNAPPGTPPSAANSDVPQHLPGSKASYTKAQIRNLFAVPDWYPDAHPPMPDIVAHGRKPDIYACGYCHLPNGLGRPENESVAGLPAAYVVQQLSDFKNGLRKSSDPDMKNEISMVKMAKLMTDDDVKAVAAYFSSLKLTPWIRVVEVEQVPKTRANRGMLEVIEGGGTEPIGDRVIEVSENLERTELRDPTSGFIAYVPKGSLAKGHDMVMTGDNGRIMSCTMCHGPDLKGTGNIPGIAGRSPSQMARQLIDFQTGARNGSMAPMMKGVVSKLTMPDIVAITGYLASLAP